MHEWKVVPLSTAQLLDVSPEDILEDGLYRRCDTYKGGGGYDKFPAIALSRLGRTDCNRQFVVQLQGCNLDCPYCYVTRAGVWGAATRVTTTQLVDAYCRSGETVFHLMGGAPALQMKWWDEILDDLDNGSNSPVFHSDLMLSEGVYDPAVLESLAASNEYSLYAINIKGTTTPEWIANTRKKVDWDLFWENWRKVQAAGLNAYVTFTGCDDRNLSTFWALAEIEGIHDQWRDDSYVIDLIEYNAVPYVDEREWGGGS